MTAVANKKLLEAPHELLMLIAGEARASVSGATFELHSPATGEVVGILPEANVDDVNAAVNAAQSAFLEWSKLTAYQRETIVRKATAHVRTQADRIGMLMALEQGKPVLVPDRGLLGHRVRTNGIGDVYRYGDLCDLRRKAEAMWTSDLSERSAAASEFWMRFSDEAIRSFFRVRLGAERAA